MANEGNLAFITKILGPDECFVSSVERDTSFLHVKNRLRELDVICVHLILGFG